MTRSQKQLLIGLPVLLLIAVVGLVMHFRQSPSLSSNASYKDCTHLGADDEPFECWYQRYETMVAKESPPVAIADLKKLAATSQYASTNCHQLTHVIGHAGYKKYNDLPKAFDNGDSYCASGYYHGVMEEVSERLGRQKVLAQLNSICATFQKKKEFGIDHHDCVHGMGHGLMAINANELFTALGDCDVLEGLWQQNSCYGGVFMENIVDEIGGAKIQNKYLKADQPLYPCTEVADKYKPECFTYQTSHALQVFKGNYGAVFEQCATVAAPLDSICYQSLGRDVSANTALDAKKIVILCSMGASATAREGCIVGAARDVMYMTHSKERGIGLCSAVETQEGRARCAKIITDYSQML